MADTNRLKLKDWYNFIVDKEWQLKSFDEQERDKDWIPREYDDLQTTRPLLNSDSAKIFDIALEEAVKDLIMDLLEKRAKELS